MTKRAFLIVGTLALAMASAVGIYLLTQNSEEPTATSSSTTQQTNETPSTTQPESVSTSTTKPELPVDELPTDAAGFASEIDRIETIISTSANPEEISAIGLKQQMLYQMLEINSEFQPEVRSQLSESNREAFDLHWQAKTSLTSLVNTERLATELPAWRLVPPEPADNLISLYKESEELNSIEWEYIAAINLVETRMGRIHGTSTAGARGPMQFLPSTWNECCEGDQANTRDAIVGAGKYLNDRGGPEDMSQAIFGYNNSTRYVEAVSAYAELLRSNPDAYYAIHSWEVFFRSSSGLILIPSDYLETEPISVDTWLEENPEALFAP